MANNSGDGTFQEVVLLDESGNEVHFDHVMTFFHEGGKYIALLPLDAVDGVGEDEVVLMRVKEQGGEDVYESIDNDVLLDEVFETFTELFDEMMEQEDELSE
ncbi:MAG: DUF1292 domain-containing protein [Bacillota bacterium]